MHPAVLSGGGDGGVGMALQGPCDGGREAGGKERPPPPPQQQQQVTTVYNSVLRAKQEVADVLDNHITEGHRLKLEATLLRCAKEEVEQILDDLIAKVPRDKEVEDFLYLPTDDVLTLRHVANDLKVKIIEYKDKLTTAEAAYNELFSRLNRKDVAIDTLRQTLYKEVCQLKQKLKLGYDSGSANQPTALDLFDRFTSMEVEIEELHRSYAVVLEKRQNEHNRGLKKLRARHQETVRTKDKQLLAAQLEYRNATQQLTAHNQQLYEDLRQENAHLRDQAECLRKRVVEELEADFGHRLDECLTELRTGLTAEIASLQAELRDANTAISNLQDTNDELSAKLDRMKDQSAGKDALLKHAMLEYDAFVTDLISDHLTDQAHREYQFNVVAGQLAEETERASRLDDEVDSLKRTAAAEQGQLAARADAWAASRRELQAELFESAAAAERAEAERAEWKLAFEASDAGLAVARAALKAAEDALAEMEREERERLRAEAAVDGRRAPAAAEPRRTPTPELRRSPLLLDEPAAADPAAAAAADDAAAQRQAGAASKPRRRSAHRGGRNGSEPGPARSMRSRSNVEKGEHRGRSVSHVFVRDNVRAGNTRRGTYSASLMAPADTSRSARRAEGTNEDPGKQRVTIPSVPLAHSESDDDDSSSDSSALRTRRAAPKAARTSPPPPVEREGGPPTLLCEKCSEPIDSVKVARTHSSRAGVRRRPSKGGKPSAEKVPRFGFDAREDEEEARFEAAVFHLALQRALAMARDATGFCTGDAVEVRVDNEWIVGTITAIDPVPPSHTHTTPADDNSPDAARPPTERYHTIRVDEALPPSTLMEKEELVDEDSPNAAAAAAEPPAPAGPREIVATRDRLRFAPGPAVPAGLVDVLRANKGMRLELSARKRQGDLPEAPAGRTDGIDDVLAAVDALGAALEDQADDAASSRLAKEMMQNQPRFENAGRVLRREIKEPDGLERKSVWERVVARAEILAKRLLLIKDNALRNRARQLLSCNPRHMSPASTDADWRPASSGQSTPSQIRFALKTPDASEKDELAWTRHALHSAVSSRADDPSSTARPPTPLQQQQQPPPRPHTACQKRNYNRCTSDYPNHHPEARPSGATFSPEYTARAASAEPAGQKCDRLLRWQAHALWASQCKTPPRSPKPPGSSAGDPDAVLPADDFQAALQPVLVSLDGLEPPFRPRSVGGSHTSRTASPQHMPTPWYPLLAPNRALGSEGAEHCQSSTIELTAYQTPHPHFAPRFEPRQEPAKTFSSVMHERKPGRMMSPRPAGPQEDTSDFVLQGTKPSRPGDPAPTTPSGTPRAPPDCLGHAEAETLAEEPSESPASHCTEPRAAKGEVQVHVVPGARVKGRLGVEQLAKGCDNADNCGASPEDPRLETVGGEPRVGCRGDLNAKTPRPPQSAAGGASRRGNPLPAAAEKGDDAAGSARPCEPRQRYVAKSGRGAASRSCLSTSLKVKSYAHPYQQSKRGATMRVVTDNISRLV
ncbi:hypothetical protein DIPPA_08816 [Diplonema papillatum]|nr:hypothetical protein DIPPA_08816 [Diplonema papillatum]